VGSINYLQALRPDKAYIKRIIENSLLADWAIRIEYQADEGQADSWLLWAEVFYAIRSAESVLAALLDCYTKRPLSTIRINAERYRPQSRILYTVYNPHFLPAKSDSKPQSVTRKLSREISHWPAQTGLRT